jgi:uncharacterized protein YraI
MLRTTRRLLTGPVLAAAIGAGLVVAPTAAQAAGATGTVRVNGTLTLRSAPTNSASAAGSLGNNARVAIDCVVSGQSVAGSVRTTTTWDRLTNGRYIPHAYVVAAGTLVRCAAPGTPMGVPVKTKPAAGKPASAATTVITGTVHSGDGTVNLRTGPSTAAVIAGAVANGSTVSLVCGVVGDLVNGTVRSTTQWNRLKDGRYISHAYVVTATLHVCKDAANVPTTTTNLTNAQFIKAAVPGAQRGWREFGVPASVTIAQAVLESGWGRSGLASRDRNYFGIKCFDGRHGAIASGCHTYTTQECTKAGKCFTTKASFRTYSSVINSFRDHGNFLKVNGRYKPAFSYTKDANRFIWRVWKAGYATDPNYYTKITGIMSANKLYQYDTWR